MPGERTARTQGPLPRLQVREILHPLLPSLPPLLPGATTGAVGSTVLATMGRPVPGAHARPVGVSLVQASPDYLCTLASLKATSQGGGQEKGGLQDK